MMKIGIIGSGAWGTALASVVAHNVDEILLYSPRSGVVQKFQNCMTSPMITCYSIQDLCKCELFIIAVPAQYVRTVMVKFYQRSCNSIGTTVKTFVIGTKGIESNSLKLMHQVLVEIIGTKHNIAVISGPNFASEVLNCGISAMDLACTNHVVGEGIVQYFNTSYFKTYYHHDIIGIQVCGALKNVYAIMSGIISELSLHANTQAAFLSVALRELQYIVKALGGDAESIMKVSGVGDMFLTCTNSMSRNMRFGQDTVKIGCPAKLVKDATVEGYYTTAAIYHMCQKLHLNVRIIQSVYHILYTIQWCDQCDALMEIKRIVHSII